jgi:hypothetical protein
VGRLRIRGEAPDGVLFELGLRGGARPLVRYRSGDVELSDVLAGPGIWQRRAA